VILVQLLCLALSAVFALLTLGTVARAVFARASGWPVLGCGAAAVLPWLAGPTLPVFGVAVALAFAGVWLGGRDA